MGPECKHWEIKEKVMANKNKQKETETFIDHDRTWRERRTRYNIREIARKEIRGGNEVKVGRNKI